jgi:response regulator of citrate/malate metabolism
MMPEHEAVDSMAARRAMRTDAPGLVVIVASAAPFQKTIDSFFKEGILHYVVKLFTQFLLDPVARKLEKIFPELRSAYPSIDERCGDERPTQTRADRDQQEQAKQDSS